MDHRRQRFSAFQPTVRRYEILALSPWFVVITFGGVVGFFIWFFLLFMRLWCGRIIKWVKEWRWCYHMMKYFPVEMYCVPDYTLASSRNYLCCCFPHGVMPVGPFSAMASSFSKFRRRYPEIEASNSQPGKYKFVVKNRKGFVKVTLRNGSPLVSVVSFGETDLFDQLVQEFIRKYLGVAPVIINGRGLFHGNSQSPPSHTKIANPTNEQVEELHSKFVQSLITLFEEYKYKYLENPEDKYLELQ
ncbi:hypothetical protein GEV33_000400 [Tenebrio molitor]|uniref:Acyltransferase n=1 Tax=Tenebrio molitor TaxID=7067 RepID=A0A8J6HUW9_TENMO|nr:hypothetical protein GEV33_000400 [Tenebrio molitor]